MKFVRPGARDNVDDRATGTTELRREAVLVDLKLLHRFFGKLVWRANTAAPESLTEEGVVVIHAVNLKIIKSSLLAADGDVAAARAVYHHARRERGEVLIITPVDRQILDGFLIDG